MLGGSSGDRVDTHERDPSRSVGRWQAVCRSGGLMKLRNPAAEVLTAIAAALDRLSRWIGRSRAKAAKAQQPEIDRMDAEIQGMKGIKP